MGSDQIKKLLGLALEIGIKASFNLHCYQFGGKVFLQKFGGPIGMRLTMSVSRVVMADWWVRVVKIIREAGMKILMGSSYVDDVRMVLMSICPG